MKSKPKLPILQRGHPLARGLVGAWLFYEGSGTVARNIIRTNYNGTLSGSANWLTEGGVAVSFASGSDSKVDLAQQLQITTSDSFTFCFDVFLNSVSSTDEKRFMDRTAPTNVILDVHHKGSDLRWWIRDDDGNGLSQANASGVLSIGRHRIVALRDISTDTIRLYLDGEQVAEVSDGTIGNISPVLRFGNHSSLGLNIDGRIYSVLYYHQALSIANIRRLHSDQYTAFRPAHRQWPAVLSIEDAAAPVAEHDPRSGFRRRIIVTP